MPSIVELPPFYDASGEIDARAVEIGLSDRPTHDDLIYLWRFTLAMAVRDGAVSVHYHPWRKDFELSYIVSGTRLGMVPPLRSLEVPFVAAAATLLGGSGNGSAVRKWLGGPPQASGRVRLVDASGSSDWAGVVWSADGVGGVEWYTLDPPICIPNPGQYLTRPGERCPEVRKPPFRDA